MSRVPSAIWVVDTKKEHIAVSEARKLGIPVVAILDTNCDPDEVSFPIPGNDDAIRSVALLTRVVADAVADGLIARAGAAETDQKPADDQFSSEEPLPEWERDLLKGNGASPADSAAPAAPAEPVIPAEPAATAGLTEEPAAPAEPAEEPAGFAALADDLVSTNSATAEAVAEAEADAADDE